MKRHPALCLIRKKAFIQFVWDLWCDPINYGYDYVAKRKITRFGETEISGKSMLLEDESAVS